MSKRKPIVLRLGTQQGWESVWWSEKSHYNYLVNKDLLIREYVRGCCLRLAFTKFLLNVVVKHTFLKTYVHVFVVNLPFELTHFWYNRLSKIIRFGVARIMRLPEESVNVLTHVLEGDKVQTNPRFLAKGLGFLLMIQKYKRRLGQRKRTFLHQHQRFNWWEKSTKGWFFHIIRRALLKSSKYSEPASDKLAGLKLRWVGKLSRGGGKRSRFFVLKKGFIPYQTIDCSVEYGEFSAITRSGLVHFEVWVYRTDSPKKN
mgnify:CR=1 FL=1|jgi:hypothetical protein|tara:strand:- start:2633 stop:3406 length:774 start_codon:yes stop_codon:yes gene_type:complete